MVKKRSHRVTRDDVAKEAGTSVAVISYVVNNGPRPVAAKTKQRVLAAIQKLNYQPNMVAKALVSGVTQTYGLVVPNISNPFLASIAHRLQHEIFKKGKVLLLGDSNDNSQREREIIKSLIDRQIDGLFYYSTDRKPHFDLIYTSQIPCIMLEYIEPHDNISSVFMDEYIAAFKATDHLIQHGYRDIGIISGPSNMFNSQERLSGWRDALLEANLPIHTQWIIPTDYTRIGGYQAIQELYKDKRLPEALFISNELQALGCLRALYDKNVAIPEDMALICFNGTIISQYMTPTLSCVYQSIKLMSSTAVKFIQQWDKYQACSHRLPFKIKVGESCGCKKGCKLK